MGAGKQQRAIDLNNFVHLSFERTSAAPEVSAAVQRIFCEMEGAGKAPDPAKPTLRDKLKDHIQVVLLELFAVYCVDPTRFIAYSRDRNWYSELRKKPIRYEGVRARFKHEYTTRVVDFLHSRGYIENVGPRPDREDPSRARRSRMRATEKLFVMMNGEHDVTLPMIKFHPDRETIILKGKKPKSFWDRNLKKVIQPPAKIIQYRDNAETRQMRDNLKVINEAIDRNVILLEVPDSELPVIISKMREGKDREFNDKYKSQSIDFTSKSLVRIFNNGNFQEGGRFYGGWWINLPSEYRHFIRIDGKDVVECDYSGMHFSMMYGELGLPVPEDDHYHLADFLPGRYRKAFKKVMNIVINALSYQSAIRAIKNQKDPDLKVLADSHVDTEEVVRLFKEKHSPISKFFHSGHGRRLQCLDSQIAEKVMLAFAKHNCAILPIHDSFVVHFGQEKFLREQMDVAFREVLGFACEVKLEYNSLTDDPKLHIPTCKCPDEANCNCTELKALGISPKSSLYWGLMFAHWNETQKRLRAKAKLMQKEGIDPFEIEESTGRYRFLSDEPDYSDLLRVAIENGEPVSISVHPSSPRLDMKCFMVDQETP
jgi:hypothetical protein